jgi:hypothetical protein
LRLSASAPIESQKRNYGIKETAFSTLAVLFFFLPSSLPYPQDYSLPSPDDTLSQTLVEETRLINYRNRQQNPKALAFFLSFFRGFFVA